ncbi:MAG: NUDIX hydrolase [Dehalococcoidia bacterium]
MCYCPQCATTLQPRPVSGRLRPNCPACGYTYYEDPKVAVGVVAEKEGRILLVRRNHEPKLGCWSFPAGFVDGGERVEDAAVREVMEEAGVTVALRGLLGVYSRAGERTVFIVYAGSVVGGEPTPGAEAMAVQYFHPDQVPTLAFPHDQQVVRDWKAFVGRT